ncbi:putative Ig domain-containing protein [Streptomyces sp. NPDC058671]|uniref:putative Ig domain-containing protein n=1 Tax=Streptomyces sp. NPDC058671 TaxID=3346590 RepID=UPI003647A38B
MLSWGADERANRVEVTVAPSRSPPRTTALRARLARLGDLVTVVESDDLPRQQGGNVVGGEKWVPGSESPCSIGFAVTRHTGGGKAFLTAGHCTNDANQAAYGKDGTRVGTSNKGGAGSVNAAEGDFGIVEVDQAGWNLSPTVSNWGQGDTSVTGSAEAVVGTAICRSGQTTGFRCGEVTKVNQSVDHGNVVINGLSYSSASSAGGDSGGAYVTAIGGKAVGLHSGGGSAACSRGSTSFSWTITTPGTGAPTLTDPGNQTASVGRSLSLALPAAGGTAPYTFSAVNLPAGLSVNACTGVVSGTPTAWEFRNATLTVTDTAGRKSSMPVTFTVWA